MTVSPNDLKTISDAILNGTHSMDDVPDSVKGSVVDYMESQGSLGDEDTYTPEEVQNIVSRRNQAGQSVFDKVLSSPAFKPIEWVGSKLYAAYSKGISPVLSSGLMAARSIVYGRPEWAENDDYGGLGSIGNYWHQAHYVSPGQAIWQFGFNDKELAERGIRPDQMAQDVKAQQGGAYRDKPTKNDPTGTMTRAQEYFGSGASKWVTGSSDFAVSWYADPFVMAGKVASGAKAGAFTRNTNQLMGQATKAAEKQGVGADRAGELVSRTPVFQNMVDTVQRIKTNSPENAALVLRRDLPTIRKSANGDTLARLLANAKDGDEVSNILRVSIGDNAALDVLRVQNAQVFDQVSSLMKKNTAHGVYYEALPDAQKQGQFGQRVKALLDDETKRINALDGEHAVVRDKIRTLRSLGNLNFNSITTPAGLKAKGVLQNDKYRPVKGNGIIKASGNLIYNASIGTPIKIIRSYNDIRPTHYIDINAEDSYRSLDASLREVKGLSRGDREAMISSYIKSPAAERSTHLLNMEQKIVNDIADRAGVDRDLAHEYYREVAQRRKNGQGNTQGRTYGVAELEDPSNPGMKIRSDQFKVSGVDPDGSRLITSPIFDTQLANSHVMMDFGLFEKSLKMNAGGFSRLRKAYGNGWTTAMEAADTISSVWKFAQLFRLGYAPRALADDFFGQLSRFGAVAMIGRGIEGGKIKGQDFYRARWAKSRVGDAELEASKAAQEIEELLPQHKSAEQALYLARSKGDAAAIERAQIDYDDVSEKLAESRDMHTIANEWAEGGSGSRAASFDNGQGGRQLFDAPFGGPQGALMKGLASGEGNFANLMGSQADWYLKKMRRGEWEIITPTTHGPEAHLAAWNRKVTGQIAQSKIGRQALAGKNEGQIVDWMRATPEGRQYRSEIGLKNVTDNELAQRVMAEVDDTLNPAIPGMDDIRAGLLVGDDVTELLKQVPAEYRPMVNAESFKYAEGTGAVSQLLDKSISGWYRMANQAPATKLLRNPLFGSSYKQHLKESFETMKSQGVTHLDDTQRKIIEENARRGALDDVKKFTFTMDAETKMAYMMRHFGGFFGAQQESWNRWARIISDDPGQLGRVSQAYGAPARAGLVVDQNGNRIDGEGYSMDPETGKRTLVDYSDRKIVFQIPEYLGGKKLNKLLGLDDDSAFTVPMSSVELILNHGDGAIPVGAGPIVQIAANNLPFTDLDANGSPRLSDMYQKLGILPLGPQDSVMDFINPTTGKRAGDAADSMSEANQRNLLYMMQVENYKYENGLRDTEPTWDELSDRATRWGWARALFSNILPVSLNAQDSYQFFRDEYQRYQKLDPDSADEKFYDKYGDSFYQFTQSMSKNRTGVKPTVEGVQMSKRYQDLIEKVGPEFASAIIGDEGDGKFSNGAYYYQKTHSTDPASNTPDRGKMSAREAWNESQTAKGWQQFNSAMSGLYSQLYEGGFKSFDDPGAEVLKYTKQAIVRVLSEETLPDGTENPYYNQKWSDAYSSMDMNKYSRNVQAWRQIVDDPELWSKAVNPDGTVGIRSDIFTMKTYLYYRDQMMTALAARSASGGSADMSAKSNDDLRTSWKEMVSSLIEQDTRFQTVHSRWFSNDLGFMDDVDRSTEVQELAQQASIDNSLSGQAAAQFAAPEES